MVGLADLWLAILLSAVLVFAASSILHMVLPWHKGDYRKMAGEESVLDAMRGQGVTPGTYMFPCPGSMQEMQTPEFLAKYGKGPVGFLTVVAAGTPAMGKNLLQWFVLSVVISVFAGYVGTFTMIAGAEYMDVFRLTGTVALAGYALGNVNDSIWKGVPWGITCKFVIDGIVYALLTAGTFAWLWSDAA